MTEAMKKNFPEPKTKPSILSISPSPLSFENFLNSIPAPIIAPQKAARVTRNPKKFMAAGLSNLKIASLKKLPTSLAIREPIKIPPTIPIRPKSDLENSELPSHLNPASKISWTSNSSPPSRKIHA